VTVTLADGRVLSAHREEAMGHPDLPLSSEDLRAKFMECGTRALPAVQAGAAYEMLAGLEDLADLRALTSLLILEGDKP